MEGIYISKYSKGRSNGDLHQSFYEGERVNGHYIYWNNNDMKYVIKGFSLRNFAFIFDVICEGMGKDLDDFPVYVVDKTGSL